MSAVFFLSRSLSGRTSIPEQSPHYFTARIVPAQLTSPSTNSTTRPGRLTAANNFRLAATNPAASSLLSKLKEFPGRKKIQDGIRNLIQNPDANLQQLVHIKLRLELICTYLARFECQDELPEWLYHGCVCAIATTLDTYPNSSFYDFNLTSPHFVMPVSTDSEAIREAVQASINSEGCGPGFIQDPAAKATLYAERLVQSFYIQATEKPFLTRLLQIEHQLKQTEPSPEIILNLASQLASEFYDGLQWINKAGVTDKYPLKIDPVVWALVIQNLQRGHLTSSIQQYLTNISGAAKNGPNGEQYYLIWLLKLLAEHPKVEEHINNYRYCYPAPGGARKQVESYIASARNIKGLAQKKLSNEHYTQLLNIFKRLYNQFQFIHARLAITVLCNSISGATTGGHEVDHAEGSRMKNLVLIKVVTKAFFNNLQLRDNLIISDENDPSLILKDLVKWRQHEEKAFKKIYQIGKKVLLHNNKYQPKIIPIQSQPNTRIDLALSKENLLSELNALDKIVASYFSAYMAKQPVKSIDQAIIKQNNPITSVVNNGEIINPNVVKKHSGGQPSLEIAEQLDPQTVARLVMLVHSFGVHRAISKDRYIINSTQLADNF